MFGKLAGTLSVAWIAASLLVSPVLADGRPNFLIAISDDQSWLYTSIAGDPVVRTPVFDRLAHEGVLFNYAFCPAPSCSPSRAAILTGQEMWRLEEAANHYTALDQKFAVFPDILQDAGYHVGFTGKGWEPGDFREGGRTHNPAGPEYNVYGVDSYAKNFRRFLDNNPGDQPFCFWFGSNDPHHPNDAPDFVPPDDPQAVSLPPFLPDSPGLREFMLKYFSEIQRFDYHLGQMVALLEDRGLLDNTVIIVTSDNGIDLPRAKANLYDFGVRVPLAVCWGDRISGGRVVDDLVSLTDIAPTLLELAGVNIPDDMTGRSLVGVLRSRRSGRVDRDRDHVFFGRERHAPARLRNLSYPSRAIRTHDFLYIRNFAPDRWPAGDPPDFTDVRDLSFVTGLMSMQKAGEREHDWCFAKRPLEELYDISKDPDQLVNVAGLPEYEKVRNRLWSDLETYLKETGDPRVFGQDGGWDGARWPGQWPMRYRRFKGPNDQ